MPRLRESLLVLVVAMLLLATGLGATLHLHDDAGQSCRLCQSVQGPDLPDAEAAFLGDLAVAGPLPVEPTFVVDQRVVMTPVILRAPPVSPASI